MKNQEEFFKVVGLGETDFDFNLNISETEIKLYKIDGQKINSIVDLLPLLEIKELRDRLIITSQNILLNIFLFLNKTNMNKTFIEYLSLNCMIVNPENKYLKEKVLNDFEDNSLFLLESNILPPSKFKINLNLAHQEPKTLVMELKMNDYLYDKTREQNDLKAEESFAKREMDRSNQNQPLNQGKLDYLKTYDPKDANKGDPKDKPLEKKQDAKKEETKKETNKEEKKSEQKEENNKEENKKTEAKKEEKKSEKPKGGKDDDSVKAIILPLPKREIFSEEDEIAPEGKDENSPYKNNDPNLSRNDKAKIIINTSSSSSKNRFNLDSLKYDFSNCNYIFIDLNFFIKKIGDLNTIVDFLTTRLIINFSNTGIILIFPAEDLISNDNSKKLVNLIKIADIVLYEIKNAQKLCNILGHKIDEEDFEKKFISLTEFHLVKTNNRELKTSLFLDDFSKFTVISQSKESGKIINHMEYKFEIGLKLEYFNVILKNFVFLKSIFFSGFFSRLVQNYSIDTCFSVGLETFKRTLDIYFNNREFPNEDQEYFIIKTNRPAPKRELKKEKYVNRAPKRVANNININFININDKKQDFILDGSNIKKSKLKEYNPLLDENLSSYFTSPFILKHLNKMGFIDQEGTISAEKEIKKLGLNIDNKKFLMKKLETDQKRLFNLIRKGEKEPTPSKEKKKDNTNFPRIHSNYSVKLPSLNSKSRQFSLDPNKEFFAGNKISDTEKLQEYSVTLNLNNLNKNLNGKSLNKNNKLPILTETLKVNDISFDNYNEKSENLEYTHSPDGKISNQNSKDLNKLSRQLVKYKIDSDNPFAKEQSLSFASSDYKQYYENSSNDYSFKSATKGNINYELNELSTMKSDILKLEVLKDISKYTKNDGKKKKKDRFNELAERHKYTYLEGKDKDFSFVKMSGKEINSKDDNIKSSSNERDYNDDVKKDDRFIHNEKVDGGGIYVPKDKEKLKKIEIEEEKKQKERDAQREIAFKKYLEEKRLAEEKKIEEARKEEQRKLDLKKKLEMEEQKKKDDEKRKIEEEKKKILEDKKKAEEDKKKAEEDKKKAEEDKKKAESKKEEVKKDNKKPEEVKKDDKKPEEVKKEEKKVEEIKKDAKKPEEGKKDDKKPEEVKKDDKKPEEGKKDDKKPEEVKKEEKKVEEVKKDDKKPK